MKITITIDNQPRIYEAYLANMPSAAQLFTRLQYGSTIDGERYAIEKDVKAIRELKQLTFSPLDNAATVTINRKAYKLPTIEAQKGGFWYIKAQYGDTLTDAAKAQLEKQIKPVIDEFCASYFDAIKEQGLQSYKTRLHSAADYVKAQVNMMQQVINELA